MATHTFATLEISSEAYEEIARKLKAAGYDHALTKLSDGTPVINMNGVAVKAELWESCGRDLPGYEQRTDEKGQLLTRPSVPFGSTGLEPK